MGGERESRPKSPWASRCHSHRPLMPRSLTPPARRLRCSPPIQPPMARHKSCSPSLASAPLPRLAGRRLESLRLSAASCLDSHHQATNAIRSVCYVCMCVCVYVCCMYVCICICIYMFMWCAACRSPRAFRLQLKQNATGALCSRRSSSPQPR